MTVALVKYQEAAGALKKAVALCDGFQGLRSDHKVLIKPNLVAGTKKGPRMTGVVTSAAVVEELVLLLQEFGCNNIAVGEGSPVAPELGMDTLLAFRSAGLADVADRRGVEFIDFNSGPHEKRDFDGLSVRISQHALQADFLINVPVLKTHNQTKVTLGLKNLKGCLDGNSKRKCHDNLDLERAIALLSCHLPTHLTIIDGIYGLQRGPHGTDLHRMDLIIAGRDILSVDIVGTALMGLDPLSIGHITEYAQLKGRAVDLASIDIRGEKLADVVKPLEWYSDWTTDIFNSYAVEGVTIDVPGNSQCSGCGMTVRSALYKFARENRGAKFDDIEILLGKEPVAKSHSKQIFLAGKCPMSTHRHLKDAIRVKGCPPSMSDLYEVLKAHAKKVES